MFNSECHALIGIYNLLLLVRPVYGVQLNSIS